MRIFDIEIELNILFLYTATDWLYACSEEVSFFHLKQNSCKNIVIMAQNTSTNENLTVCRILDNEQQEKEEHNWSLLGSEQEDGVASSSQWRNK